MAKGNFFSYVKAAFLYHWNLLVLGVGTSVALISGKPDVVLPLLLAGELVYLSYLSSNPRYQKLIDAINQLDAREKAADLVSKTAGQILKELNPKERHQFDKLQLLCMELQKAEKDDSFGIQETQMENINRLLWIYLKLLYSKKSMEKFFAKISIQEIQSAQEETAAKIKALGPEEQDSPKQSKHRRLIGDTYETLQKRLDNFQQAKENYEFVQVEIERLSAKISSIAEMGISHQDHHQFTTEIDIVSSSVTQTEKTMTDLEYLTGVTFKEEQPPELLRKGQYEGE